MPPDSEIPLGLDPAGTGQAMAYDDDLASVSPIARLRIADARTSDWRTSPPTKIWRGRHVRRDACSGSRATRGVLTQSVTAASIACLDTSREAREAEHSNRGSRGQVVQLEGAAPRPEAAADSEPRLLPVEAIARSPVSPSVPCAICMADITDEVVRAPCGHTWDVPRLSELFQRATTEESLYPRPAAAARSRWPSSGRTSGPSSSRSFWRSSRSTRRATACTAPSLRVRDQDDMRTTARGVHSRSARCTSRDDVELAALAEREGTFRCRFEFCYVCGGQWKTCNCPQRHEERLRAAAEDAAQWRPLGDRNMDLVDGLPGGDGHEEDQETGRHDATATYDHPSPVLGLDPIQLEPEVSRGYR